MLLLSPTRSDCPRALGYFVSAIENVGCIPACIGSQSPALGSKFDDDYVRSCIAEGGVLAVEENISSTGYCCSRSIFTYNRVTDRQILIAPQTPTQHNVDTDWNGGVLPFGLSPRGYSQGP